MSTWNQHQSNGGWEQRRWQKRATRSQQRARCCAQRDWTRPPEWGVCEMRHVQFPAEHDMQNVPQDMGQRQRQVSGHRRKVRVTSRCIRDSSGESLGTTSNDAVGSSLEGGGGSQSCGDGRTGGRHHYQSEKRNQSKKRGATQTTTSGKTAGRCGDCAHARSHTDDQEESGSGSGGSKSRPGEGNTPDCVSGTSEMCIADSKTNHGPHTARTQRKKMRKQRSERQQ